MPYVIRDADGKIVQVFEQPVTGKSEAVSADSADYKQFVDERSAHSAEELRQNCVELHREYGFAGLNLARA